MVTCSNGDSISKKMNKCSTKKTTTTTIIEKKTLEAISGSLSSSACRLLIGSASNISGYSSGISGGMDAAETISNWSRNSIYKQRIDSMFDDSKSMLSHRSTRRYTASVNGSVSGSNRLSNDRLQSIVENETTYPPMMPAITNNIQAQIEKMFTDIAEDDPPEIINSFAIKFLGSLPLTGKITSLSGLQEPLRQLYLSGAGHGNQNAGFLDICKKGLRIRLNNGKESQLTPFQNIAVWSAVKFVVSQEEGGAAFLPLITDPENIDKAALFKPLSAADKRRLSSGLHSPLFTIVIKSFEVPKQLDCHGYICSSAENAIVIAATLYQGLISYMSGSQKEKHIKPRTRNGISCLSITSNSAITTKKIVSSKSSSSQNSSDNNSLSRGSNRSQRNNMPMSYRASKKKRSVSDSSSSENEHIRNSDTSSGERDKNKHSRLKKPPPLPVNPPSLARRSELYNIKNDQQQRRLVETPRSKNAKKITENGKKRDTHYGKSDGATGDILTKVAIPRSGSFLNTAGLTRYKSRVTRRNEVSKVGSNFTGGGGGGSPLGFSELFNEFRLQENLHSLDDILNVIINYNGMSFNDLKPIYKEFLLKLAVTLTKDELYQRSKSIMRRQKKKKMKRNNISARTKLVIGALGLKKILLGKFRWKKGTSSNGQFPRGRRAGASNYEFEKKTRNQKADCSRIGTSESEVSVHRNLNALNLHNRNSSSGYVSCSECSYDSDNCTCDSADRCYCSLRGVDITAKVKKAEKLRRDSLRSCESDDKCYCSMSDDKGSTTWCDTDSCASAAKCYCSPEKKNGNSSKPNGNKSGSTKVKPPKDDLTLDYEFFNVGPATSRHVRPNEALSVKKSVEMAALFADVKLSQTTDITNLDPKNLMKNLHKKSHNDGSSNDEEVVYRNKRNNNCNSDYIIRSNNKEIILKKDIEISSKMLTKSEGLYQAITPRPVSASLEDSLGYLP